MHCIFPLTLTVGRTFSIYFLPFFVLSKRIFYCPFFQARKIGGDIRKNLSRKALVPHGHTDGRTDNGRTKGGGGVSTIPFEFFAIELFSCPSRSARGEIGRASCRERV